MKRALSTVLMLNGRVILVRFVFSDITSSSFRFEQAFSDDWGQDVGRELEGHFYAVSVTGANRT